MCCYEMLNIYFITLDTQISSIARDLISFLALTSFCKILRIQSYKKINFEMLKRKILLQNIRYYTKHANLIAENSKIDILYCQFAKLLENQKTIVVFAFLPVIVVFHNISTTAFYLYYDLNTSVG